MRAHYALALDRQPFVLRPVCSTKLSRPSAMSSGPNGKRRKRAD
jgi:hypothetical protein